MTATVPAPQPVTELRLGGSSLATLLAAVRTQYRSDVIVPPADHPLVDLGRCIVSGCPAMVTAARGLCGAHGDRWYRARRRGVVFEEWLATCPSRCTPGACLVPACGFGQHRQRLCPAHYAGWTAAGASSPTSTWASTMNAVAEEDHRPCRLSGCELWASFQDGFCISHQGRLNAFRRRTGIQDPEAFLSAAALAGQPHIEVTGLAPQLKLEVQYVVQTFLDNGPRRVNLARWDYVVRALRAVGATSLLERTPREWTEVLHLGRSSPDGRLFLQFGWDQVDRLLNGTGWAREYPLDTWVLDRVGHAAPGVSRITFASLEQDWLRDLVKQWTRHRLSVGINPPGVRGAVTILGRFSSYLAGLPRPPREVSELSRAMVQSWCESLAVAHPAPRARIRLVTALSTFLRDVHQHGWSPDLAATTVVFSQDFPLTQGTGPARALPEYVMAQLESETALARLPNPAYQLMVRLLIRCGLRAGDCRRLAFDCLVRDGEGHPYLQYVNHKMRRTAFIPLDDDLADRIEEQQRAVLDRFARPRPGLLLFPGVAANPHGIKALPASGFRSAFQRWLAELAVTDEHGQPVWITPHQLRHTFGTRLINRDVKQHIVQQLMDHSSPDMTAHYARLSDKTVRDAWAKAQLIDVQGNRVDLPDEHPLAGVIWARRGLDKAKQTLPNGYCGMPLNSPCEHANPCLTCPLFITNADFLPQHEAQLRSTLELIDISAQNGHQRIVEKNEQIAGNLRRIITACHQDRTDSDSTEAG